MAVVIVVVLHDLLLWQQSIDYLIFLPSGKEKRPSIRAKTTGIAYISLTALNTLASQNVMHESTKGSP
jgi:hypothetical protein